MPVLISNSRQYIIRDRSVLTTVLKYLYRHYKLHTLSITLLDDSIFYLGQYKKEYVCYMPSGYLQFQCYADEKWFWVWVAVLLSSQPIDVDTTSFSRCVPTGN